MKIEQQGSTLVIYHLIVVALLAMVYSFMANIDAPTVPL